jgi:AraC-like DNA-binding protein
MSVLSLTSPESGAWDAVRNGWRQIYGNFRDRGLSIELHDFISSRPINWGRSFHDDSVELCLNLSGQGQVKSHAGESIYTDRTVGFYCNKRSDLAAIRMAGVSHSFITVELSRPYLMEQLESCADGLLPGVRSWINGRSHAGQVSEMTVAHQTLFTSLRQPPVVPQAFPLWYQSKALELLSQTLFKPIEGDEFFCQRHQRVARERVERAISVLQANLSDPPDIDQLGAQVGCSPFYLSRLFSREMGMTIPQFLRQIRMEHAAELLLRGRHNVTEVAMEVGYSSLSHFSKAFCQTLGCCPALFSSSKACVEKFRTRKPLVLS